MVRVLVLNGPNLNLLGERDPGHYGTGTLEDINRDLEKLALKLGVEVICRQSNHEGVLIDLIHEHRKTCRGMIINPGALTHYSYSLHDAIEAVRMPTVEVHLSDIHSREEWRQKSVITPVAWKVISGKGPAGYLEALEQLALYFEEPD
ncbi:MAG: type II 3-dehydroquinate dehydratase [Actinobacteria bacterium]|nr:type II 3-dehydroquinate dehydratase [Actinomycetota bacterium]